MAGDIAMAICSHLKFSKFENAHSQPSFLSDFASSYKISRKFGKLLPSYLQKIMFSNLMSDRHLEFKNLNCG